MEHLRTPVEPLDKLFVPDRQALELQSVQFWCSQADNVLYIRRRSYFEMQKSML